MHLNPLARRSAIEAPGNPDDNAYFISQGGAVRHVPKFHPPDSSP
jgi:hypothetical protein